MVISGLAFRTWRPFAVSGPFTIESITAEARGTTGAVTTASLSSPPTLAAVIVLSSPVTLPQLGSGSDQHAAEPRWDRFPVVVPFTAPFNFPGGDLHLWIRVASNQSGYSIDSCADGSPAAYGMRYVVQGPSPNTVVVEGQCPILGLLADLPLQVSEPRLEVFGEPWVGNRLDVQLRRGPPSTWVQLYFGSWQPDLLTQPCASHLGPSPVAGPGTLTDAGGFARFSVVMPVSATFVHSELGMQSVFGLPGLPFSNACRIHIGGGL